jgi:hypothetical protein
LIFIVKNRNKNILNVKNIRNKNILNVKNIRNKNILNVKNIRNKNILNVKNININYKDMCYFFTLFQHILFFIDNVF